MRRVACGLAILGVVAMSGSSAQAQRGGMGMRPGAPAMAHDSATQALARGSHQLVMSHDRIRRTVTNLPNGIRTVTESDDPRIAALIREHVSTGVKRLESADDPGLPIESPALRALFPSGAKVRTVTEATAKGIRVTQTADDTAVVALIQKHAADVSTLVERGMAALHESMQQGGGMGTHMGGGLPGDSAFRALQERGRSAMGVDQYTSSHRFEALPDGGRIQLQRDVDDSAGVGVIRAHLLGIVQAFSKGDFTTPEFVHMRQVPGAAVMASRRELIAYSYRDLPRGGEVRMETSDARALDAIHEFLAFQRAEHRAP